MSKWTRFMDMHSGGSCKESPYEKIYIEASEDEAITIFYNRFGHNPHRVTCTCCGDDYGVSESDTLEQSSAYDRGCAYSKKKGVGYIEEEGPNSWDHYRTVEEYAKEKNVLLIRADEIKDDERVGDVPEEGYVWR